MEKLVLFPVDLEVFLEEIRTIVKEEIKVSQEGQQEKLLSPAAACNLFDPKISRGTLHNWEKEGRIKGYLLGGKKLFKLSDILEACQKIKKYKK